MRLLPHTALGTWRLAGVVWLAGCVVLWVALPARPRAEWRTDQAWQSVGFVPGTHTLLTHSRSRDGSGNTGDVSAAGPARLWDADSGAVRDWLDSSVEIAWVLPSPDGQLIAVHAGPPGWPRLRLHRVVDGAVVCGVPVRSPQSCHFARFSRDGGLLAYDDVRDKQQVVGLWDVQGGRELPPATALRCPCDFSPDGSRLAAMTTTPDAAAPTRGAVRVIDLPSRAAVRTLPDLPAFPCRRVSFSPDGRHVVAAYHVATEDPNWSLSEVRYWNAGTGELCKSIGCTAADFPERGDWFLTTTGGFILWGYDDPGERRRLTLQATYAPIYLSADGRTLVTFIQVVGPLTPWLQRLGLGRLAPPNLRIRLHEPITDREISEVPQRYDRLEINLRNVRVSDDGRALAVVLDDRVQVWDVPVRRPWRWIGLAAAGWTVMGWLGVRWRVRRLGTNQ